MMANHTYSDSSPFFDNEATQNCHLILVESQNDESLPNFFIICLKYSFDIFQIEDKNNSLQTNLKYRIDFAELKLKKELPSFEDDDDEELSITEMIYEIKNKHEVNFLIFKGSEFSKNNETEEIIGGMDNIENGNIIAKLFLHPNYIMNLELVVDDVTEDSEGEKNFDINSEIDFVEKLEDREVGAIPLEDKLEKEVIEIFENFLDSESLEKKEEEEEEMFGFKVKFIESDEEGKIQNLFSSNMFGNIKERSLEFDEKDIFTDSDFKKEINDSEQKNKESNSNNNEEKNEDEEKDTKKEKESSNKTSLFSKILRVFVAIVFIITIIIVTLVTVRSKNSKKKLSNNSGNSHQSN